MVTGVREMGRFIKFSPVSEGSLMRKKLEPKEHGTGIKRSKESFKRKKLLDLYFQVSCAITLIKRFYFMAFPFYSHNSECLLRCHRKCHKTVSFLLLLWEMSRQV